LHVLGAGLAAREEVVRARAEARQGARAAERRAVSDACEAKIDASEALRREAPPAPLMPNQSPRRAFLARLDELLTRYRPMTIAEFKARNALLLSSSDARAEAAEAASMGWANVEHLIRTGGSAASLSAAVSAAIELTDSAYVGHGSSGSPTVGPVPIDPGSRLTPAS
jgi:hypothetical protein